MCLLRTLVFRRDCEMILREFMSSRIGYIRGQLELVGEDGQLHLPADMAV